MEFNESHIFGISRVHGVHTSIYLVSLDPAGHLVKTCSALKCVQNSNNFLQYRISHNIGWGSTHLTPNIMINTVQ